jgi:hypothetical protein
MKTRLIIIFCVLLTTACLAQNRKTFKINPGQKPIHAIPIDEVYKYPHFKLGKADFKNGRYATALFNYNYLYGEMQFIDEKGDTLSLNDAETVKFIAFGKDTFFYDKGFVEALNIYGDKKLASKQFFSFVNSQKLGGFGEPTSASVDAYNSLSSDNYFKQLVTKEIVILARYKVYYIGDRFNHFILVNKKNVLNIFDKPKGAMGKYLKENNIDFSKEEDVVKLIDAFKD